MNRDQARMVRTKVTGRAVGQLLEIAAAFHALSDCVVDETVPPVILRLRTTASPATTRTRQPTAVKSLVARPGKRAQKAKEKRQAEIIKLVAVCVGLTIWYVSTH